MVIKPYKFNFMSNNLGKGIITCPPSSSPSSGKTTAPCTVTVYASGASGAFKSCPAFEIIVPTGTVIPAGMNIVFGTYIIIDYTDLGGGKYTTNGWGQIQQSVIRSAVVNGATIADSTSPLANVPAAPQY